MIGHREVAVKSIQKQDRKQAASEYQHLQRKSLLAIGMHVLADLVWFVWWSQPWLRFQETLPVSGFVARLSLMRVNGRCISISMNAHEYNFFSEPLLVTESHLHIPSRYQCNWFSWIVHGYAAVPICKGLVTVLFETLPFLAVLFECQMQWGKPQLLVRKHGSRSYQSSLFHASYEALWFPIRFSIIFYPLL